MPYPPRLPTRHAMYHLQYVLSSRRVTTGLVAVAVLVAVGWSAFAGL
jgi:hypothetical protein